MRRLMLLVAIVVSGCSAAAASPLSFTTLPTSDADTSKVCIIEIPAQGITDLTPITIVYRGINAATCQDYLQAQLKNATGWSASHPAIIVTTIPTSVPVCTGKIAGISVEIYGTAAAKYTCAALGL